MIASLETQIVARDTNKVETAFIAFCNGLKHPVHVKSDHMIAFVNVTCYRKTQINRYCGAVLLITHGHGAGSVRIEDGQQELIDEGIYHVLESENRMYVLGRSGRELVIEIEPLAPQDIYRIELEENLKGAFVWNN